MGKLYSPNGLVIVGTCDTILATASFDPNSVVRDDSLPAGFDFAFTGDTEVHWDTQETRDNEPGDILVQDEDGDEWPLSMCRFVEDADQE